MQTIPFDLPKEHPLDVLVISCGKDAVRASDREKELLEELRQSPGEPEPILWQLLGLYHETHNVTLADAYARALLGRFPAREDRARLHFKLGQLAEIREEFEIAADHYRDALAQEPLGPLVRYYGHNNLAFCLNLAGRHAEAERHARIAIERDPHRYNAHKNLGIALEKQGDFVEAARSYARAMKRTRFDFRALHHMEELLEAHPEVAEQVEDLEPYMLRRIRFGEMKREIVEDVVRRFGKDARDAKNAGASGEQAARGGGAEETVPGK